MTETSVNGSLLLFQTERLALDISRRLMLKIANGSTDAEQRMRITDPVIKVNEHYKQI